MVLTFGVFDALIILIRLPKTGIAFAVCAAVTRLLRRQISRVGYRLS